MKPVAIFRYSSGEGPGYFAEFLSQHNIPFHLIAIDHGECVPAQADDFSGLCLMGGAMSVNDPLPWIEPMCQLIRHAIEQNIPVIGHCLGGQLMSKALGGCVTRNPVKEIGWSKVFAVNQSPLAQHWLGNTHDQAFTVFQWHGDTFSLPQGATHLLSNQYCPNQAFVLGPHLGLQCHVEMTPTMINDWCAHWDQDCAGLPAQPNIQTVSHIQADIETFLPSLQAFADQLYSQWIKQLSRAS